MVAVPNFIKSENWLDTPQNKTKLLGAVLFCAAAKIKMAAGV